MRLFKRVGHDGREAEHSGPGFPTGRMLLDTLAVVVDVETTGIVKATDRVYEVGIVTFDSAGTVVDRFETLVRPDGPLSERLAGPLADAPGFAEVAGEVVARLQAGVVVGHGAAFDLSMLDRELARVGGGLGLPEVGYLCTSDLALALHVDSPSRRLGMLCHVLGVDMGSWHSAAGDAGATGRLLGVLLAIADSRQLGDRLRRSATFAGSATGWPSLPRGGRLMARNPATFPPAGDQPDSIDPIAVERGTVSVSVDVASLLSPELQEKVAAAVAAAERRNGGPFEESEWDRCCDQWEGGNFRGAAGLARLRHILEVFLAEGDDQAADVALRVAQFLRYDPGHSHDETQAAYATAFAVAQALPADDGDRQLWAVRDVVGDWSAYLAGRQDIDGLASLAVVVGTDSDLLASLGMRALVHQMRTAGQVEPAVATAERFAPLLAAGGAAGEAADVCAEEAQGLADSGRPDEALGVCDRARARGWSSRDLANRYSLLLERAKNWPAAAAACEEGLKISPTTSR